MNIPKINHNQLHSILNISYENRLPVFIHGTFGIGKSFTVKEWAKAKAKELGLIFSESVQDINSEKHFLCLVIPLHQYDSAEVKGIPVKSADGKSTEFLPTSLLPRIGSGILFFDELNLAPPMIQANAYQLIHDRRLGNYVLPDGYVSYGAGNTDSDMAHTFSMANPLKNRFGHAELTVPTVDRWVKDFAIQHGIDNREIAFLSSREQYLFSYDADSTNEQTAIASPRTWEMMSKAISKLENDSPMLETFVGMFVGTGIAREFMAHIKLIQSYDIASIMKGGEFKTPKEIDEIYAFISGVVSYYLKNLETDMAKRFYEVLSKLPKEYSFMGMFLVVKQDKAFFKKMKTILPKADMDKLSQMIVQIAV